MIVPNTRTLAVAEYEGTRYVLEDRGGVYIVGQAWGIGKLCRTEREARVRFHEATGGAALDVTTQEETSMNPVNRHAERVDMAKEASEHLEHALEACSGAREKAGSGFYLSGALAALDAQEEATRAKKLLMRAFGQETEDTLPEPTEEQKAEWEREVALYEASEDLLEACEAAVEYMGECAPRTYNDRRIEVYAQLRTAIEKARPQA